MTNVEKEKLLAALDNIKDTYDAYLMSQRYGDISKNTHKEDFNLLLNALTDEQPRKVIWWIVFEYDCYYSYEYDESKNKNVFGYLRFLINQKYGERTDEEYGAIWDDVRGMVLTQD